MSDKTDYIKREDAIRIANQFWYKPDIAGGISELPSADVVEVVRCKDCKYFDREDCCERIGMMLYPEDVEQHYCSYGERKEE